jgi:hypothetical protein
VAPTSEVCGVLTEVIRFLHLVMWVVVWVVEYCTDIGSAPPVELWLRRGTGSAPLALRLEGQIGSPRGGQSGASADDA